MRIGILGGTGPAGRALAARLASAGFAVLIGSRSEERAGEMAARIQADWPGQDLDLRGVENADAAAAEAVVVATPWDSAAQTAASVAAHLDGKVVLSMANALVRIGDEFQPLLPARGSIAATVQAAVPGCQVVAAFHHIPARELGDIAHPVTGDVLLCSDHPPALEVASEIVARLPHMRPLRAGGLAMATPIESFTAVLLQLNVTYKTRVSLELTGLPGEADGQSSHPADPGTHRHRATTNEPSV